MTVYNITPIGKPRMTQRDKWKKRPAVVRYHDFKDQIALSGIELPLFPAIIFYIPMPESWSKKKKESFCGRPHKNKPDIDNLQKALFDALYDDDAHIWTLWPEKRWAYQGAIEILDLTPAHDLLCDLLNSIRGSDAVKLQVPVS